MPRYKPPQYAPGPGKGIRCAECGEEHPAIEQVEDTLLAWGFLPDEIQSWKDEQSTHWVYKHAPGQPQIYVNAGDKAQAHRERQARYRERQKADTEGRATPKWAKKRHAESDS